MSDRSPSRELTERFLNGQATRSENATVVRALILGPAPERMDTEPVWESAQPADAEALAAALDRVLAGVSDDEARLEDERRLAARLAEEIERRLGEEPCTKLEDEIRSAGRFHVWALSDALRNRSFETGLEDPERAVSLARLAVCVAELAAGPGSRPDRDLLAAAWAQLGNALRVASDLRQAEAAFETARTHLEAGTGDPLVHAQLLSFEASLASDQARFRQGIAHCRKATRLYRRVGDLHDQGRMLIQEAGLHVEDGDLATAIACLDRAVSRVDAASEPRLALVVLHNLASYLDQQERYDEAWERLAQARALARRLGHRRLDLVRLRWLEGRIAAHRGDTDHAEVCWNEARAAFVELKVDFDAALVSLELADLLARQGRRAKVVDLVEKMVPIFRWGSLHREAQTALKIFCDTARDETAEITHLAREVGRYLKETRNRPGVPFRSSRRDE